jgi:hypothetical protein
MADYQPYPVDFSALESLGEIPQRLRMRELRSKFGSGEFMKNGVLDYDAMYSAMGEVDPVLGANLATRKSQIDADNEYRNALLGFRVAEANRPKPGRIVNLPDKNGVQQPFELSGDGQITPVQAPGVGQRYKQMNVNDITKLSEEGGKAKSVAGFVKTFSDNYGGYGGGFQTLAQIKMLAGRTGWADPKLEESATWWQGYDKYKANVRNDLYGSALTPQEQEQWERADVNPAMDPAVIRQNLALQDSLIQGALERKTGAMKAQGYNPRVIDEAYGVNQQEAGALPPPGDPNVNRVQTVSIDPSTGQPMQANTGGFPSTPSMMPGAPQRPQSTGPLPVEPDPKKRVIGQVYVTPDGKQYLWAQDSAGVGWEPLDAPSQ